MTTLTFDTLKYAKQLEAVGVEPKVAEVQAEALVQVFDESVASKRDIKEIDLKIEALRAELRKEIELSRKEIIIKLGGIIVACTAVLGVIISISH